MLRKSESDVYFLRVSFHGNLFISRENSCKSARRRKRLSFSSCHPIPTSLLARSHDNCDQALVNSQYRLVDHCLWPSVAHSLHFHCGGAIDNELQALALCCSSKDMCNAARDQVLLAKACVQTLWWSGECQSAPLPQSVACQGMI